MTLKAVLFDFNGIIINDEPIHQQLLEDILLGENIRPNPEEIRQVSLGRSDRVCLKELLMLHGRFVSEQYLDQLLIRKANAYIEKLATLNKLPIYPTLADLIFKVRVSRLKMAVVSGALLGEIEQVLTRAGIAENFAVIVAGDEIKVSKPEPDGYLLAVERLNQIYPELNLKPWECLAIEDSFAGIQAAKNAGIPVVGVAHTYPFHMLHRRANWTIDYLSDLDLDQVREVYQRGRFQLSGSSP